MSLAPFLRPPGDPRARRATAAPGTIYHERRATSAVPVLILGLANTALGASLVLLGAAVFR